MSNLTTNKRIAQNTVLLYIRMIFLICVQLYTVPIILKTLGIEDYGIFNVVAGIVIMFSFIGSSLASGAQRFIAFEIGKKNQIQLRKVFNTSVTIYTFLGILLFILLEFIGYWFLNFKMNIPNTRLHAANWVFQLSIITFGINLISIPYNALVIAHERMNIFAYITILECILKLITAIILKYIPYDHLIIYSAFICCIALTIRIIYQLYCNKSFNECKEIKLIYDKKIGKELLMYSSWNMIGALAIISRQQGLNLIINLFFGPILNAAHSIAQQFNGVLTQFINNVYIATRPQITKYYACGEYYKMWNLVFKSSKLAFYLMMLLTIPLLFELPTILALWLHETPPYTIIITKLMIISLLIETLANQIIGAYQAANRIRRYQLMSSTIILSSTPISYILLKFIPEYPTIPYCVSIGLSILYIISILWNAKNEIGLDLKKYTLDVIIKIILVYVISCIAPYYITLFIPPSLARIIFTIIIGSIFSLIPIWLIGLNKLEKESIIKFVKQRITKNEKS